MTTIKDKMHLIPQPVIDCAEGLASTKQEHMKLNYIVRLETIRDYCDNVLKAENQFRWKSPLDKQTKSQLNYSRIGKNNV